MKYLSLFSGIGGFELGIQQTYEIFNLGRSTSTSDTENRRHLSMSDDGNGNGRRADSSIPKCVGFSEIDKYAVQIYQSHFPEHKNYGDITKINEKELPDFDLIVGGFPCQSFSIAGKRGGFDDARGTLFFEIARILRDKQPRLLLLENVKGLLSHDKGNTLKVIIATLDELGYDLQWQVLNSKNFSVPQNRERVFIVGHLRGTSRPEVFPFIGDISENSQTVGNGFSNTLTGRSVGNENHRGNVIRTDESGLRKIRSVPDNYDLERRETHTSNIRRLTPTECERLQGFPDGWTEGISDSQRYKCLGNAVTVNVVESIMEKLIIPKL